MPLALAITGVGAATVSMIENGAAGATPQPTAWLFGGFVAVAMLSLALLMRLLADFARLESAYRPTMWACILIAAFALGMAALDPASLVLAATIFLAMGVLWVFALFRWLSTSDGQESPGQGCCGPGVRMAACAPVEGDGQALEWRSSGEEPGEVPDPVLVGAEPRPLSALLTRDEPGIGEDFEVVTDGRLRGRSATSDRRRTVLRLSG